MVNKILLDDKTIPGVKIALQPNKRLWEIICDFAVKIFQEVICRFRRVIHATNKNDYRIASAHKVEVKAPFMGILGCATACAAII